VGWCRVRSFILLRLVSHLDCRTSAAHRGLADLEQHASSRSAERCTDVLAFPIASVPNAWRASDVHVRQRTQADAASGLANNDSTCVAPCWEAHISRLLPAVLCFVDLLLVLTAVGTHRCMIVAQLSGAKTERVRRGRMTGQKHGTRQLSTLRAPACQQVPPQLQRARADHGYRSQSGKDYHIDPPSRRSFVPQAGRCYNSTLAALCSREDVGQPSHQTCLLVC